MWLPFHVLNPSLLFAFLASHVIPIESSQPTPSEDKSPKTKETPALAAFRQRSHTTVLIRAGKVASEQSDSMAELSDHQRMLLQQAVKVNSSMFPARIRLPRLSDRTLLYPPRPPTMQYGVISLEEMARLGEEMKMCLQQHKIPELSRIKEDLEAKCSEAGMTAGLPLHPSRSVQSTYLSFFVFLRPAIVRPTPPYQASRRAQTALAGATGYRTTGRYSAEGCDADGSGTGLVAG